MIQLCSEYLSVWCIWLHVLIMSRTRLWVWPNVWVFVYELSGSGFESSCSQATECGLKAYVTWQEYTVSRMDQIARKWNSIHINSSSNTLPKKKERKKRRRRKKWKLWLKLQFWSVLKFFKINWACNYCY